MWYIGLPVCIPGNLKVVLYLAMLENTIQNNMASEIHRLRSVRLFFQRSIPDVEKKTTLITRKPFSSLQNQNIQKRPQVNKLKNFSILIIP